MRSVTPSNVWVRDDPIFQRSPRSISPLVIPQAFSPQSVATSVQSPSTDGVLSPTLVMSGDNSPSDSPLALRDGRAFFFDDGAEPRNPLSDSDRALRSPASLTGAAASTKYEGRLFGSSSPDTTDTDSQGSTVFGRPTGSGAALMTSVDSTASMLVAPDPMAMFLPPHSPLPSATNTDDEGNDSMDDSGPGALAAPRVRGGHSPLPPVRPTGALPQLLSGLRRQFEAHVAPRTAPPPPPPLLRSVDSNEILVHQMQQLESPLRPAPAGHHSSRRKLSHAGGGDATVRAAKSAAAPTATRRPRSPR